MGNSTGLDLYYFFWPRLGKETHRACVERCRTLQTTKTSPRVSWKLRCLCDNVLEVLCGGMEGEEEGLFPESVTVSLADTFFERNGGCVAISAVPGGHRHSLKSWVAQINRGVLLCLYDMLFL